jgi:oligoribonuclease NrnB/cAMP/cGMP phosphodiesterase (DHH superfamily)
MITTERPVQVIYHDSCDDGFGAAYAAWVKYGDKATYVPANYGKPPVEIIPDCDLFIVDFSFDKQTLEKMRAISNTILVLDHHEGAKQDLEELPYAVFDMDRSGAVMAWQHFNPETPIPDLLLGVQDRDLWNFELPTTEALSAGLRTFERDFDRWDVIAKDRSEFEKVVSAGQPVADANKTYIASISKKAKKVPMNVDGRVVNILLINSTHLVSDLGHALCRQNPDCFAALLYTITNEGVLCSFRSTGGRDVCKLAKTFGGGGHKNAAGFKLGHAEFFDRFLK